MTRVSAREPEGVSHWHERWSSAPLLQLLSRLELAERLATQGYGLSLVELAQLVEQPLQQLERRSGPWRWRDWQVQPLEGGRWRLHRDAGGLGDRE